MWSLWRMLYCRFSFAGNSELVKSIVETNFVEVKFVYILKREVDS